MGKISTNLPWHHVWHSVVSDCEKLKKSICGTFDLEKTEQKPCVRATFYSVGGSPNQPSCGTFDPISDHSVALLCGTEIILWHFFVAFWVKFASISHSKSCDSKEKPPAVFQQRADGFKNIGRCYQHPQFGFEVVTQSTPIVTNNQWCIKSDLHTRGGRYGQTE